MFMSLFIIVQVLGGVTATADKPVVAFTGLSFFFLPLHQEKIQEKTAISSKVSNIKQPWVMFPLINALIAVWTCQLLLDEMTTNNFQHDLDIISICVFSKKITFGSDERSVNPSATPLDHP